MRASKLLVATLAVGLGVAACGSDGSEGSPGGDATGDAIGEAGGGELETVSVGHVQLSIFSPLYVADAKGYFADEGIELELQNIKSGQDGVPLASSGQLDVLAAGFSAGMFSAIETGLNIKVVGSMGVQPPESEESPSALIVSSELVDSGEYEDLEDLEGLDIGASGGVGGTSAFYISLALEEAGLDIRDVNLVNVSNPDIPAALANGSIDAAFSAAPFWTRAVSDGAAKEVWTTPEGTSGTGVIYGDEFAQSDLAQPFFDALAKGAQDLQGEKRYSDENLQIIAEATDQTAEQVASVPLYTWYPDLHPLPEQLAGMEEAWMKLGALNYTDPLPEDEYVDSSFAENVSTDSR